MGSIQNRKVLIVGAGISGLLLAQILRKANIAVEIFERDDGSRNQGWSVGLDKCLPYLRGLLLDDIESFRATTPDNCEIGKDGFAIMDSASHAILGTALSKSDVGSGQALWVSRNKLRNVLARHIDVQYGKYFKRYEEGHNGVTVYFVDGSKARGTVLVGADGANSGVRRQLLPGFRATESRYTMLNGNVVLPKEMYDPVLEHSSYGILAAEPSLKFYLLLEDWLEEDGLFSWNCSWTSDDWQSDHTWSQNASRDSLHQRVKEKVKHFPEYIQRAIELTGPDGMQQPPIRLLETVLPDRELPDALVTLVGDAAHSMVPFRGMGANTAIIDACELGAGIIDSFAKEEDLRMVLRRYGRDMVPRGRQMVLESRATGESMDAKEVAGGRI